MSGAFSYRQALCWLIGVRKTTSARELNNIVQLVDAVRNEERRRTIRRILTEASK
jgi:hypothetical protein